MFFKTTIFYRIFALKFILQANGIATFAQFALNVELRAQKVIQIRC